MDNNRLRYLLARYRDSACNPDELAELNDWFHTLNYGSKKFESWVEEAGGDKQMAESLFSNFQHKIKSERKVISMRNVFIGVAASILIVMTIGVLFLKKQAITPPQLAHLRSQNKIIPGKNKAYLTLADGSKIVLDDASKGKLATQAGITITKKVNGLIVYNNPRVSNTQTGQRNLYNTIETPRGGQYQVQLPDGSSVLLNAGSKLRYPLRFGDKERLVELTGEAYFEVAHNKRVPFKVHTGDQEVRVLGTHFNINGYNDDPGVLTTLVEGSVMLSKLSSGRSVLLSPGQQGSLLKSQQQISVKQVNVKQVLAWKNGYFIFDNQDISTVMKMLSRWYDVDIEYKAIDKAERFGGSFSRYSNISDILSSLQIIGKVRFKIENHKIIVSE